MDRVTWATRPLPSPVIVAALFFGRARRDPEIPPLRARKRAERRRATTRGGGGGPPLTNKAQVGGARTPAPRETRAPAGAFFFRWTRVFNRLGRGARKGEEPSAGQTSRVEGCGAARLG